MNNIDDVSPNHVSLKEYMEGMFRERDHRFDHIFKERDEKFHAQFTERDKRFNEQMEASKMAVQKAEDANERRLNLLNEFRAQSVDEGKKYALRETVNALEVHQARLYGGMVVIGAIGIANLVRLWAPH